MTKLEKLPEVVLINRHDMTQDDKNFLLQWVGMQLPHLDQLTHLHTRGFFILSTKKEEIRIIELHEIIDVFNDNLKGIGQQFQFIVEDQKKRLANVLQTTENGIK